MRSQRVELTSIFGKHRRLLLSVCLGVIMMVALTVSVVTLALAGAAFPDVPASHPYYTAINQLSAEGIIGGYTNGNFGPGDEVTRQQFAKMIVLTCGYYVSESDVCYFTDVQRSDASSLYPDNYVAVCAAKGITVGTTPTTFSPLNHITRYQVISMAVRAADNIDPDLLASPPVGWAGNATWASNSTHGANAARAEYNGLLAELNLAALSPTGNMNRGEVAQVLYNLLVTMGKVPGTTGTTGGTGSTTGTTGGTGSTTGTTGGSGSTTWTLSTSVPGGGGTITSNPNQTIFNAGATVILTAVPAAGYTFSGWSGDATGTSNPYTVTMNGNKSITATFTAIPPNQYALAILVQGSGTVTRSLTQTTYPSGTSVTLTALADEGHTFSGWSGDASGNANPYTVTMNGPKTITATFVAKQYTLSVSVPLGHGTITRSPSQSSYAYGSSVILTATPDAGYAFHMWVGDGGGGNDNPWTVYMDSNKTITAEFTPREFTLVTSVPGGGGIITRSLSQSSYTYGSVVVLTAVPDAGYTFTSWGGDAAGITTNPYTVTMTGNKSITATFAASFEKLGGVLSADPAVCSGASGLLDVFIRGVEGNCWHKRYSSGGWSGWENLGGDMHYASAPAAVGWGTNNLIIFIRGADDAIWARVWHGTSWSSWESQSGGGFATSSPAACYSSNGGIDLFVRGSDGALWVRYGYVSLPWSSWIKVGGVLSPYSSPGAAFSNPNRADFFIRGTDDALWWNNVSSPGFAGWTSLGGVLSSGPGVSSWASGQINVVARGTDFNLWYRRYNGVWTGWLPIGGGEVSSAPAAASWGPDRIDVFVRGTDDQLWHKWWDGSAWRP
jgi:uncharacterized repeat protein (TIGR02543 family)